MSENDGTLSNKNPIKRKMIIKNYPKRIGDFGDGPKGKKIQITYERIVEREESEWINPDRFLPIEYDLVRIITTDDKELKGWSTKSGWDGRRFDRDTKVYRWKRVKEYVN